MKVELLIYAYLAVCAAMIVFNIVCIFVFRHKDKQLDRHSKAFAERIRAEIESPEDGAAHRAYLSKELRRVNNLMAFDKTLEVLYSEHPEKTKSYIESLSPVFIHLTPEYQKKNKIQAAYFPYIIKKYHVFRERDISAVKSVMLELVREESLYCRENALQALYSIGDCQCIIDALRILDINAYYHHSKLITDGLLEFSGDKEQLAHLLWEYFQSFSLKMQLTLLDYFRFSSGEYCEQMLRLMISEGCNDEIRYSCIRYFGKYHHEAAYPFLLDFAEMDDGRRWEYAAISASALENYPSDRTTEMLKTMLSSRNWYVRFNASKSLDAMGLEYADLIDVFEGDDRFAGEMMRYRFDQKKMREKEVPSK